MLPNRLVGEAVLTLRSACHHPRLPWHTPATQVSVGPTGSSSPVAGATVFLYSLDGGSVGCTSASTVAPPVPGGGVPGLAPVCSVVTDALGAYTFAGLPCGKFTVVPKLEVRCWGGGGRGVCIGWGGGGGGGLWMCGLCVCGGGGH
jgi:hypothetical protein